MDYANRLVIILIRYIML